MVLNHTSRTQNTLLMRSNLIMKIVQNLEKKQLDEHQIYSDLIQDQDQNI
ncbi:hypothetical protein pb186bvf_000753 [Paramecium bursaria]